jgi:hypothetical protein
MTVVHGVGVPAAVVTTEGAGEVGTGCRELPSRAPPTAAGGHQELRSDGHEPGAEAITSGRGAPGPVNRLPKTTALTEYARLVALRPADRERRLPVAYLPGEMTSEVRTLQDTGS